MAKLPTKPGKHPANRAEVSEKSAVSSYSTLPRHVVLALEPHQAARLHEAAVKNGENELAEYLSSKIARTAAYNASLPPQHPKQGAPTQKRQNRRSSRH